MHGNTDFSMNGLSGCPFKGVDQAPLCTHHVWPGCTFKGKLPHTFEWQYFYLKLIDVYLGRMD